MEPLATTKRILIWICMLPIENPSRRMRIARIVFVVMLFLITLFAMYTYIAFIVENVSTHLEDALLTFMTFVSCAGYIYAMIVAFFTRYRVPAIFQQLSTIYDLAGKFH